jgi:hypothetical protein
VTITVIRAELTSNSDIDRLSDSNNKIDGRKDNDRVATVAATETAALTIREVATVIARDSSTEYDDDDDIDRDKDNDNDHQSNFATVVVAHFLQQRR